MFIDINKIEREGFSLDRAIELPALDTVGSEPIAVLGARVVGRLSRGSRGVDFDGRLEATVRPSCSRCLEPFEIAIDSRFFLTIVRERGEGARGEVEVTEEDSHLYPAPEGKVDLRDLVVEQLYLNLPLKPVCRADCRGLCPSCGENRNSGDCGCRNEEIDPRLAPLVELKNRRSGDA